MPRLTPCPSCEAHVFVDERVCPHCGASLRTPNARVPAVLIGLALTGCPLEPEYGVPDPGETETPMESGTETATTGETTTTGEPEYGVPETT